MAGIYLHIPFCKQACHYCDFHFSTDTRHRKELVDAMVRELELQKGYLEKIPLHTIYFGGGTPSLLDSVELTALLDAIHKHYIVDASAEITLEANPDDLSFERAKALKSDGVNRLSIGIQSFDNGLLPYLNRAHDSTAAVQCLQHVREAGFTNISLDLIYAIPGLSMELWDETIRKALTFSPEHLSAYSLTIEDRTVFGNWRKNGKLRVVDEETEAKQFEMLIRALGSAGYQHYEISNFSKPGFISRHNSNYWKREPYLGIGPSAHAYNGKTRQSNVRNNAQYVRSIAEGKIPFEEEILSRENTINEFILTGLRTMWGCDLEYLRKELGDDLNTRCGVRLEQMEKQGLIERASSILTLTPKGKLLADQIAEDLMTEV